MRSWRAEIWNNWHIGSSFRLDYDAFCSNTVSEASALHYIYITSALHAFVSYPVRVFHWREDVYVRNDVGLLRPPMLVCIFRGRRSVNTFQTLKISSQTLKSCFNFGSLKLRPPSYIANGLISGMPSVPQAHHCAIWYYVAWAVSCPPWCLLFWWHSEQNYTRRQRHRRMKPPPQRRERERDVLA